MSRPTPPTCQTRNWPAFTEARERRVARTIWFDAEMVWDAAPTGENVQFSVYD